MNKVFETIYAHKSIRKFKEQPLAADHKEALMKVIGSVPTSINGQNFSIIMVEDKQNREKLVELTHHQPYVAQASIFFVIVMDFYRSNLANSISNKDMIIQHSIESIMVGSVDAGIILGQLIVAAESLGLGTVPIGAVRNAPSEIVKMLQLPKYTFPVVGLCVGIPDETPQVKPRLPREAVVFKDHYNTAQQKEIIENYDKTMTEYNKNSRGIDKNWTSGISDYYSFIYFPKVFQALKDQGFDMNQ